MLRMLFIALLILFLPYQRVFAQPAQPSSIDIGVVEGLEACDGGDAKPGERCRKDGDLPNPTFIPGSDKAHCHEVETEITDPITGKVSTIITIECVNQQIHIRDDNFIWSSHKDAGNYDLFNLYTMLEQARLPLTPASIWEVTTRNTNPQLDSWIARGCTYSRQTNQPTILEKNELSKQIMTLTDPYIATIVENLEFYKGSSMGTAKLADQYYQKATELVRPSTAYPCNYSRVATDVIRDVKDSGGKAEFSLLEIIKKTLLFILEETSGTFKVITETGSKPFGEEMHGGMKQAKDEDFVNSRISLARKDSIKKDAGIVETFRPCSLKYEGPELNGEVNNEYEWESSGETFDIKSRQHLMKSVDESTNFLQSTLLPASLQTEEHKKKLETKPCGTEGVSPSPIASNLMTPTSPYACMPEGASQPESENTPTSDSPSQVTEAAATAGIPNCVLDGVYAMESSRGANSSCTPNVCGAVGPFAITVGFTGSRQGGGQCSKDTACSQCPAGYCPNAIEGTGLTAADMCDTGKAAAFAARLLKGKADFFGKNLTGTDRDIAGSVDLQDAIIAGGNSYFGSNHTFTSGQNIEPGCSYGESVLKKYCGVSSYICGSRNFDVSGK